MTKKQEEKRYSFQQFNKELNELYDHLIQQNYDESELRTIFQPLLKSTESSKTTKVLLVTVLTFTTLIYVVSKSDKLTWHLSAVARILLIKLLPFWNWTQYRNGLCLLKLPETATSQQFNCGMCEHLTSINKEFSNISHNDLMEKYLDVHSPVLIKDGLDWNTDKTFIDDVYDNDILYDSFPCLISSSLNKDNGNQLGQLMEKARKQDRFYLHFQNCDYEPMRVFRKYTYPPQFLPNVLSPVLYNWMVWNKSYNTTKYKPIELIEKEALVGQIHGETEFRLLPRKNCETHCEVLNVKLQKGESILLTSLWDLEYRPVGDGENVAVILEIRG